MYVMLNNEKYPAADYNLSFTKNKFARTYRGASVFSEKFYGMNEIIAQCNISLSDYKDLYPLMVFDISKQSEKLKSAVVDLYIKATFNTNVPTDTYAFAVVISDKMLQLQSDRTNFFMR